MDPSTSNSRKKSALTLSKKLKALGRHFGDAPAKNNNDEDDIQWEDYEDEQVAHKFPSHGHEPTENDKLIEQSKKSLMTLESQMDALRTTKVEI